jgi:hypothetical protein
MDHSPVRAKNKQISTSSVTVLWCARKPQGAPDQFIHIRLPLKFLHIDATPDDHHTFVPKSPDLLLPPGTACGYRYLAISLDDAMPGQTASIGHLGKHATNPTGTALQARELSHLPITRYTPFRDGFDNAPDTLK